MREQQPLWQALLADTVQIVSREDGDWRNRRQDVARKFRAGEGKEEDREESPKDEELREGVSSASVAEVADRVVTNPPLGDSDLNRVYERAESENRPRHEREDNDHQVEVNRLVVQVTVA